MLVGRKGEPALAAEQKDGREREIEETDEWGREGMKRIDGVEGREDEDLLSDEGIEDIKDKEGELMGKGSQEFGRGKK